MKQKFEKFIPIQKIDEEERMVYGWASTEDVDSDGEIIKASALEKALPAYLKFPTLREMHQPIAVGTTKEADIKKDGKTKGLWIGAKVVAKDAWEKVKEGVYPAFSIGGNVLKKMGNVIHELELIEISLVDVPANKAAVVELWKRDRLTKNAETAYSMANLMIQVKDKIAYWEYLGKDSKKLKKCLEMLKEVLAAEAMEPEPEKDDEEGMFMSRDPEVLKSRIKILEAMEFQKNSIANIVREGVIRSMKTKVNELKKEEDLKEDADAQEETTEGDETLEDDPKKTAEKDTETETEGDKTEKDTETTEEEDKETGELSESLQKISDANKTLEKISPKEKDEKVSKDLVKAVSSMAGSLAKFADALVSMNDRVTKLENTPAAPKSKSAVVLKSIKQGTEPEKDGDKDNKQSEVIAQKKTRLQELNKIFESIGANQFAKQGYSQEAMKLKDEIAKLEAK